MHPRNIIELPGSKTPILFLHGFPSESTTNLDSNKNLDIAQYVNSQLGHAVYLIHYEGLGKNRDGRFSFSSSLNEAIAMTEVIIKKHGHLIVIGHSWGGYISLILNLLFPSEIRKTITLSPLCFLPERNTLEKVIEGLCQTVPYILKKNITPSYLTSDLIDLDKKYFQDKATLLKKLSNVHILHAKDDNEVPVSSSREIVKMNHSVFLQMCDTDHSFAVNRHEQIKTICGLLAQSKRTT